MMHVCDTEVNLQAATVSAAAPLLSHATKPGGASQVLDEYAANPWAVKQSPPPEASKTFQQRSTGQTSDVERAAAAAKAAGPLAGNNNAANWPRCCPVTRLAIDEDVQPLFRGTVRYAYITMLIAFSAVFANTVTTLVLWLAPHTPPGILKSGLNFGISWIYSAVVPLCAYWHFTYLYSSMRFTSPGKNTCFSIFSVLAVAFDAVAITGIPHTGLSGVWTLVSVLNKGIKGPTELQCIFIISVFALFTVHMLLSLLLLRSVRKAGTTMGALSM